MIPGTTETLWRLQTEVSILKYSQAGTCLDRFFEFGNIPLFFLLQFSLAYKVLLKYDTF